MPFETLPGYDAWATAGPPDPVDPQDGRVVCPECDGHGFVLDQHSDREDCPTCAGDCEVPDE